MTAAALFVHTGRHLPKRQDTIFRRLLRGWRREGTAVPGAPRTSGAATALLANRNAEALGFPMRVQLTPAEHADAMQELYALYADRQRPVNGRVRPTSRA